MYWLYVLGGLIESRGGTLRFALLVLVAAVVSNLAQYFNDDLLMLAGLRPTGSGGPNFGGFSGVGFATFGYVWVKSKYDPGSGMFMASGTAIIFLIWLFLCMTGSMGNVANSAHVVGLLVGLLLGLIPAKRRRT
jgi:GlpG protein